MASGPDAAGRAGALLARQDYSRRSLIARLLEGGCEEADAREVVSRLVEAGLLDDARLALRRAEALATRGHGNAAIAARLERSGFEAEDIGAALATLTPEIERARRLVGAGTAARDARRLARLGFDEEAIVAAVAGLAGFDGSEPAE